MDLEISQRCIDICNSLANQEWYKNQSSQIIKKRKDICNKYPDIVTLLNEYDEMVLALTCKTEREIYTNAATEMCIKKCCMSPNLSLK